MHEAWKANEEALEELSIPKSHAIEINEDLERALVERREKLLERDSEPIDPSRYKEPVIYYESSEGTGGLPAVVCTCGWYKRHLRMKVLQKAAWDHFDKTGHRRLEQ